MDLLEEVNGILVALYREEQSNNSKLRFKTILELRDRAEEWINTPSRSRKDGLRIAAHYKELFGAKAPEMTVYEPEEGQAVLKIGRGGRRPGAGRKASGKQQKKVSLLLDPEQWEQIEKIKEAEGVNQSDLLGEMISLALVNFKLLEHMNPDGTMPWEKEAD